MGKEKPTGVNQWVSNSNHGETPSSESKDMVSQFPWSTGTAQPTLYSQYQSLGWVVTHVEGKSPVGKQWNKRHNCIDNTKPLPEFIGVGLCHAYSGTVAIDIDDWTRASFELMMNGINLQALYEADDAVIIDSGRQGHGKLLYKMPFGLALNSKKLLETGTDGKKYNYIDFRCGTANAATVQDVLPGAAIHPDTGKPYRWAGKGHFSRLPQIPAPLLDFWLKMLKKDSERKIQSGMGVNASWDEIRSALNSISPDISRAEWINVGMALHWAGEQTNQLDEAFQIWDEWSQPSSKYQPHIMEHQWLSFRSDKGSLVKLGTLYHAAREGGWVRPTPDASELFSALPQPILPVKKTAEPELPAWMTAVATQTVAMPDWMKPKTDVPPSPSSLVAHYGPKVNFDLFPSVLAKRAQEVTREIGCDPAMPLWAGIAAVCAAADSRTKLWASDSFNAPPIIWSMIIAESGSNKSSGSADMLSVIRDIEMEDRGPYSERCRMHIGKESAYKSRLRAYEEAWAQPENMMTGEVPPIIEAAPPSPVPLSLLVSDITSQKLLQTSADNPRGVLCFMDEMNHWLKNMVDPRTAENRSAWVQGFEGKPYKVSRKGTGDTIIDNYCVSFLGNVQPEILNTKKELLSQDGLFQRFIPVIADIRNERLGQPTPKHTWNVKEYESMIRLIHSLPQQDIRLSEEATVIFREFQAWQFDTKMDFREMDLSAGMRATFNKMPGLALRLALVFHLMESPFSSVASADVISRAIRVVREMIVPSIASVYGEVDKTGSFDKWVMDHVSEKAEDNEDLSLSQIKRSAIRRLSSYPTWQQDRMVMDAMAYLESQYWVELKEENKSRNSYVWLIRPEIRKHFIDRQKFVTGLNGKHRTLLHGLQI